MGVNIYNQCSNFKLIYQGYFSNGATCNERPHWGEKGGSSMCIDFVPFLAVFEGALICKLQKEHTKIDDQSDPTYILLFVAWKSEGYKKFYAFVHLIEYDKTVHWDEIKIEEYYQSCASQLSTYIGPIKDTWSIPNDTVLMTELKLGSDFTQRDGVLNVTISEGIWDSHTRRPEWVILNE
jgi:hypothetical protein